VAEPNPGALAYDGLDARARKALVALRACVESDIVPVARALDAADEFPEAIVDGPRELGMFGFTIPRELGGRGHGLHAQRTIVARGLTRRWRDERDGT
jgi:alkylation response protein AidB-like acyl-CoA dehydrogenase